MKPKPIVHWNLNPLHNYICMHCRKSFRLKANYIDHLMTHYQHVNNQTELRKKLIKNSNYIPFTEVNS